MRYTSFRDITVASTCGLSIHLKKGVPTACPPGMHDELLAKGCVPEAGTEEPDDGTSPKAPTNAVERYEALCKAFEKISLRNERTDFNAAGVPHAAVLAKELGYAVNNKERDPAWAKWQHETAAA